MTDYNKTNEVQPVSMPTGGLQN